MRQLPVEPREETERKAHGEVAQCGHSDPAMRFADGCGGLDGGDPGNEGEPSGHAAEIDFRAESALPCVAGDEGEQDESGVDKAEDVAQHEACLAERQQSEGRRGGTRRFSDFQSLSDGYGAQQQVEAVAARFAVLVKDDQRREKAERDAEEGRGGAEVAAQDREENQEGSANTD